MLEWHCNYLDQLDHEGLVVIDCEDLDIFDISEKILEVIN